MNTSTRDSQLETSVLEVSTHIGESAAHLKDYLQDSMQQLATITERVSRGETIDFQTHHWMLDQVDYLVEMMGDESLELDDELRSNLLQLLLSIANLNEQIRRQGSLGL